MFGPTLRRSDQPLWKQVVYGLFDFCASLKLAVILILACALALAWATFVESAYGTPAVQFGMYGSWWFGLLNLMLAINIFAAAAIRYPWKRHQTGFVITHIGLLVLLFGCLMQRRGGIDAQMPIFEGQVGRRAFEDSHHFQLALKSKAKTSASPELINIPFTSGPFNWQDFRGRLSQPLRSVDQHNFIMRGIANGFAKLNGFLFRLATRDTGVLYAQDGVKLEVLDYYSDSTEVNAPLVKFEISSPRGIKFDEDNRPIAGETQWDAYTLSVINQTKLGHRFGIAERQQVGGGAIIFGLAGIQEEVDAFLQSAPEGSLGDKGQVVLHAKGETIRISVDEKLRAGKFDLGNSGLQAEIVEQFDTAKFTRDGNGNPQWINEPAATDDKNPLVRLQIYQHDKPLGQLTLLADLHEYGTQDFEDKVFGVYWFDYKADTSEKRMAGKGRSRIDILQTPLKQGEEPKLVYRYWNGKELVFAKPLPTNGEEADAFEMPIAKLKLKVEELVPADRPGRKILPLAFNAKKQTRKMPAVLVRLMVDDKVDEFWLPAIPGGSDDSPVLSSEKREIESERRLVTLTLPPDEIDVGFGIRLHDFERRLDPGTSQPSHYSSTVDLVNLKTGKPYQKNVFITMNAPVDFSSPESGKSYRLFQESFYGPIRPGSHEYDKYFAGRGVDEGYMSTLTVNYDPGRAMKYTGCLLIVAGIGTMFYMRAYFFKPTGKGKPPTAAKKKHNREPATVS